MAKMKIKFTIKLPKTRKPVANKANSFMKSKKQYTRKPKHKKSCSEQE